MLVVAGWVVVLVAVIGSFVLDGGHIASLLQPFELMCIFGAAIGSFVVSNPLETLVAIGKAVPTCFAPSAFNKKKYLELIALLFELLQKIRTLGMLAMESDIADPDTSPIFTKYPTILKDRHLRDFIVDYFRMMVEGNVSVSSVEDLMNAELETHHAEMAEPAAAIQNMADALPAFGIVSAVMGVVHTMGSVGAPPAVLGEMIASALVGTFLGILLSYGFVGPVANVLVVKAAQSAIPYECVKSVLLAHLNGSIPSIAVEFGRKVLTSVNRPSFSELDDAVRATKESATARAPVVAAEVQGPVAA